MKTLVSFPLILLLSSGILCSSDKVTGADVTHSAVFDFPERSKEELYLKSMEWYALNFKDERSKIEFIDKDGGKIVGKYFSTIKSAISSFDTMQTIQVDVKEGKVKITFTEPLQKYTGGFFDGYVKSSQQAEFVPIKKKKRMDSVYVAWKELESSFKNHVSANSDWGTAQSVQESTAPTPPPFNKNTIFVNVDGKQYGPYSETQVKDMISKGQVRLADWAWKEGMADWKPVSEVIK